MHISFSVFGLCERESRSKMVGVCARAFTIFESRKIVRSICKSVKQNAKHTQIQMKFSDLEMNWWEYFRTTLWYIDRG